MEGIKIFILIFMGIFLVSLTSANIIITPGQIEVNNQIGKQTNYSVSIFNNFTFDIFDITIPDLEDKGFRFDNLSIAKNTSGTLNIYVQTNESFSGIINARVKFTFLVDLPEEIKTYPVLISDYGFNPTYLTIRQGDTIQWTNEDDISHSIYSLDFGTITIPSNESNSHTFNEIDTFNYYDLSFNIFNQFNGIIQVVNRTEPQNAYNQNYDGLLIVNLNSFSEPTNITITNDESNFTIEHTKSKNGLLTINNTGNNIAEKVFLSANSNEEWIIFDKNNFSINPGDKVYVGYTVLPFLLNTSQSNRTYNIEIGAKALNSGKITTTISLFVPFKEITTALTNDIEVGIWYKNNYCPLHPCSIFCDPQLPECTKNQCGLNGSSSIITTNMTSLELYSLLSSTSELRDLVARLLNNEKAFQDKFGITIQDVLTNSSKTLDKVTKNEKTQKVRTNVVTLILSGIIIIAIIIFVGITINKKSEKESYLGDASSYGDY